MRGLTLLKFVIAMFVAALGLGVLFTQTALFEAFSKHTTSSLVGLDRTVSLYTADGTLLRQWQGNILVEDQGGSFSFVLNGKSVKVMGTVVVEESN